MKPRSVLCPGTDCKKRGKCLLYTTPPTKTHQAYFTMACSIKDVDNCRWFASNEEKRNVFVILLSNISANDFIHHALK